jgi:hypothetical protein
MILQIALNYGADWVIVHLEDNVSFAKHATSNKANNALNSMFHLEMFFFQWATPFQLFTVYFFFVFPSVAYISNKWTICYNSFYEFFNALDLRPKG